MSDKEKRKAYDRYGKAGLNENSRQSYGFGGHNNFFHDNMDDIFNMFFRSTRHDFFSSDPFFDMADPFTRRRSILKTVVTCTLEELYNGFTKVVEVQRSQSIRFSRNKRSYTLEFPPGLQDGDEMQFQLEDMSELVVMIRTSAHPYFKVKGSDLIYRHSLPLSEAMGGCKITLNNIDGNVLNLEYDELITPDTVKVLKHQGMRRKNGSRGNLIIEFNIIFPDNLSEEKRKLIQQILIS